MKTKSAFFCQECGYESAKWAGQCPSCAAWNTFLEAPKTSVGATKSRQDRWVATSERAQARKIEAIVAEEESRLLLPDVELNRSLGGGLVLGSVSLIAGEPGIGKSTLFLQCALKWKGRTLYISGEESAHQIKMRAQRLDLHNDALYLLTTTDTETIFEEIKKIRPQWVIIDSIQTLSAPYIESAPGSISQVRECTAALQRFAKETNTPVSIIGHITKDGGIAGPKILEHIVDTVLQFEGDRHYAYRILRTLKNRFGATSELAIYAMDSSGMTAVSNPSEMLMTQHEELLSGIVIAAIMEGSRPLMVEVQALITNAVYGNPQRTANGFDPRRLQLLLAVLEKRGGFQFSMKDIFLNIAGGLKIEDPAIDLAVACALLSSLEDRALPAATCFVGEVGLSGEIRAVNRIDQRIAEAEKMGMEQIFIPWANARGLAEKRSIEIRPVQKVSEVYQHLFCV